MTNTDQAVSVRVERITIPTYGVGQPQKNPLFLEKRVYQGSSGAVYPYPVIERVDAVKTDRQYTAIFLENRYLLIMLLPELGGRVQMALDKTNDYHFVYYNRVIKPALVGLAGPWISGGIEFNWPQHLCLGSQEDFFGGYDHFQQAGLVHIANHHISPGKKHWTWGKHNFGYAWDRNLTDEDGPYIELMAGVYIYAHTRHGRQHRHRA
jgi:hypothetical protein